MRCRKCGFTTNSAQSMRAHIIARHKAPTRTMSSSEASTYVEDLNLTSLNVMMSCMDESTVQLSLESEDRFSGGGGSFGGAGASGSWSDPEPSPSYESHTSSYNDSCFDSSPDSGDCCGGSND